MSTIDGIACPDCGEVGRRVMESRRLRDRVRRRCVCSACDSRFTTYELRYDQFTAQVDVMAATRAARLLGRFQAVEASLATLRQHLEEELNASDATAIPMIQAEPLSCEQCIHWEVERCDLGHPDPIEEGVGFAQWCATYAEATS